MWLSRTVLLTFVIAVTAACGFQPLYGGGKKGQVAAEMASISINPIADRRGQQLHNALLDLLTPYGRPSRPAYELKVQMKESKSELAVRKSEIATRANLTISAQFQLVDLAQKRTVYSGSSRVVGSYNILSSDFSTLVAEDDARSRVIPEVARDIQTRLSAYFRLRSPKPAVPPSP